MPHATLKCTTVHRHLVFRTRYSVMYKFCTGYNGASEIEHGLCACTVNNPLSKAHGLSLGTGAQTMLYLSRRMKKKNSVFFIFTSRQPLTLLHSERPKLCIILACLSAIGIKEQIYSPRNKLFSLILHLP